MPKGKNKIIQDLKNKELNEGVRIDEKKLRRATTELIKRKTSLVIINLSDAKILISRIILQLQQETIETVKAKSLLYAVSVYISCYRECDFENRLTELEKKLSIERF